MSKVNMEDIRDMDILLYSKCGNYKVKPTEIQRDYILNFLKNSTNHGNRMQTPRTG